MSRNCPLQLLQGAHRYFWMDGSMQSANALKICSSFLRPATWKRQSGKLFGAHDGKAAAAAAAVIVHPVGLHLPELRADLADNFPLRFDHAHEPHQVAGIVQCDGKVVAAWIELDAAVHDDVAQQRHGAFTRNVQISGQHSIGNDRERFVGVPALAQDDLLDPELFGGFGVLDRYARELARRRTRLRN